MPEPKLLLSRHPFVHTDDMDEAREIFGRFSTPIRSELLDRRTPFTWRGNSVRLSSIAIGANAYGA